MLDPLAHIDPPAVGACDHTSASYDDDDGDTLDPGVYCGGIQIIDEANITFNEGIYVLRGGSLTISGTASVTGDYVGFYLTEGATLNFSTSGGIALKAPSSGPMAGILFFQDRNDSSAHHLNSAANVLEGTLYMPTGEIHSWGSNVMGGGSNFTMYIAERFFPQ